MECFQVVLQYSHEGWQTVLVAHGGLIAWLADAHPLTLPPQQIRRKKISWEELAGGEKGRNTTY